jgi:hypothetical protein
MLKVKKPDIKEEDVEKFIQGAKADKATRTVSKEKIEGLGTYLLRIPIEMREEIRIEATKVVKNRRPLLLTSSSFFSLLSFYAILQSAILEIWLC